MLASGMDNYCDCGGACKDLNYRAPPVRRYAPIRTPARKLMATPTPIGGTPLYHIPEEDHGQKFDVPVELEGLPELKPEDHQYFGKLLKEVREAPGQRRHPRGVLQPVLDGCVALARHERRLGITCYRACVSCRWSLCSGVQCGKQVG